MSTSTLNTSMNNTQTGPTPSTSMDINFDIYGSRFHSVNRGSSSVVHCLWNDTAEVSYVELDETCQIDDILYLSANMSVEVKHFEDNTCFVVYQLIDMLTIFVSSQILLYLILIKVK